MTTTISIRDQVLSLVDRIKSIPSGALIKLLLVLVKPVMLYWAGQVNLHSEAMGRYPKDSAMHKSAEAKYTEAFDHWHRVSYLVLKIEEASKFRGLGGKLDMSNRPKIRMLESAAA